MIPTPPAQTEDGFAGLEAFVAESWRLEPHTFAERASYGRWRAWPHLAFIGRRVAEAIVRGNGRVIINLPPGHGKSEAISHWMPAWLLENLPEKRVILTSHSASLATHWARIVRNEFEQNLLLFTKLAADSTAAAQWNTPEGGGMFACGIGGGVTGFRANVILVDDPHPTWEEVQSLTHRRTVQEWFSGTLYDRLEPNGSIIILAHRWHEDDLPGWLIENHKDKWDVIRLPALAEPNDVLGRAEGEALCPQRFDADALKSIQRAVGDMVFSPKYQQNPTGVGSNRVYHQFSAERNVAKGDERNHRIDLPLDVTFDFNYNPGMHAVIGQHDDAADVIKALREIHAPYMRVPACVEAVIAEFKRMGGGGFPWPWLEVFGDPAGNQNRPESPFTAWQQISARLGEVMKAFGKPMKMKVPSHDYGVRTRMETFNDALCDPGGVPHYFVDAEHCPRLMEDFKRLKTDVRGLIDKSDEKLSHSSEAEANRVCRVRPMRKMTMTLGRVVAG